MFNSANLKATLLVFSILFSSQGLTQTRYVTDQFEVTLRSGSSTSNSIISMLKSGDAVEVIEQDSNTKYSLVETAKGKQGYILTRFLDEIASGRTRSIDLRAQREKLKTTINTLKKQATDNNVTRNDNEGEISTLRSSLNQVENELNDLKSATHDTILIIQQNDTLKSRINELEADKLQLLDENANYKDSTAMDWFIRGSSVSLIAFLLGIIVTRIKWKKRDTWGSY